MAERSLGWSGLRARLRFAVGVGAACGALGSARLVWAGGTPKPLTTTDLRRMGEAFADVADRVSPSVVQIEVTVGATGSSLHWFKDDGVKRGMGSGVVYSADGAIVTSNHVIDDARSIKVRLRDGRVFKGRVVGRDPATDLAVLRVDANDLTPATLGDSDKSRVGEWVVAIGSPFGLDFTITTGVLSAKGRGGVGVNAVEDYLQTDASINPGNSGGPLVNLDGQVLGINTMIVSKGQGIGMAVPSNMVRRVAEQILRIGRVDRARMSVGVQDLTPQLAAELPGAPSAGALINAVGPGGPASKANLQPGDVIVKLGGRPVLLAQDVIRAVFAHNVGDTLALEVVRAGKHYRASIQLESRGDPAPPRLPVERAQSGVPGGGLSLSDLHSPNANKPLAQVREVVSGSVADQAGLRPGDVILDIDGVRSPTADEAQAQLRDGRALLRIRRNGSTFYTTLSR